MFLKRPFSFLWGTISFDFSSLEIIFSQQSAWFWVLSNIILHRKNALHCIEKLHLKEKFPRSCLHLHLPAGDSWQDSWRNCSVFCWSPAASRPGEFAYFTGSLLISGVFVYFTFDITSLDDADKMFPLPGSLPCSRSSFAKVWSRKLKFTKWEPSSTMW